MGIGQPWGGAAKAPRSRMHKACWFSIFGADAFLACYANRIDPDADSQQVLPDLEPRILD